MMHRFALLVEIPCDDPELAEKGIKAAFKDTGIELLDLEMWIEEDEESMPHITVEEANAEVKAMVEMRDREN